MSAFASSVSWRRTLSVAGELTGTGRPADGCDRRKPSVGLSAAEPGSASPGVSSRRPAIGCGSVLAPAVLELLVHPLSRAASSSSVSVEGPDRLVLPCEGEGGGDGVVARGGETVGGGCRTVGGPMARLLMRTWEKSL